MYFTSKAKGKFNLVFLFGDYRMSFVAPASRHLGNNRITEQGLAKQSAVLPSHTTSSFAYSYNTGVILIRLHSGADDARPCSKKIKRCVLIFSFPLQVLTDIGGRLFHPA